MGLRIFIIILDESGAVCYNRNIGIIAGDENEKGVS